MNIAATVAAAMLLGAGTVSALETPLNFDQGVDVSGVVQELKGEVKKANFGGPLDGIGAYSREERDCADISFGPNDPTTSERVYLESRIYEWRCYGDRGRRYPRDPYYPRRGIDRPGVPYIPPPDIGRRRGRDCYEEWVRTERRRARVMIQGRGEMLPWERDVFQVCLQGDWLTAHVRDASHKYDLEVPGWRGDTVMANAIRKTRSQPDPYGIKETAFRFDEGAGNFVLELADRWIEYYEGEKVGFTLKLRRYHKNWFDSTVLKKEITIPASATARINFADFVGEVSGELKPGKKYYVEWRFKRIGKVSKDDWQKYRETGKAHYQGEPVKPPPPEDDEDDWAKVSAKLRPAKITFAND